MKLVIVESPTKARTIQGFLGKSYKVISSMGHIIDLPPKSFGVSVENNFAPRYVTLKREIAEKILGASRGADVIILATDPDREGEAIAYHIKSLIKKDAKRALFYEITRRGVECGMKELGDIDMAKVEAQQARRILDRLVGYEVSPLLWKVFNNKELSAGRVQSVALRLICEREQEIREFKPEEFWEIKCKFFKGKGDTPSPLKSLLPRYDDEFTAKLVKIKIPNQKEATEIENELERQEFIVKAFTKKGKQRAPYPPYITSTMQQDASARLRFSTKQTMRIAQQLFEGIELGKVERVGLITYMRTDSVRVAPHAISEAREYIVKELGKEYLPEKPRIYGKEAGAHEAIRPTGVKRAPELIKEYLAPGQFRLYSLIWQRFLASQTRNARYEQRSIDIRAGEYELRAESEVLKFAGFTEIYKIGGKKEDAIPEVKPGTQLALLEIMKEQKFTQPKPRYTEGSIVKELESKGIGRPSTYAPIISRIIEKDYVRKIDGRLAPTELGEAVNKVLVPYFPDTFNVNFTREMEEGLDKIESKETDRVTILKAFYKPFKEDVTRFIQARKEVKQEITQITGEKCELCGSKLAIKWGRYGKFLACLNYPNCNFTKPITLEIKCPECGGELIERRTKKGKIFYGCSNYPKCKFAVWDRPIDKKCPSCGYPIIVEKKGKLRCPKCNAKEIGGE